MLGDTGTELLHDAACSVLVARRNAEREWEPRDVVVGLDGSPCSLAALAAADELASRLGSEVEVLSADDSQAASAQADLVVVGSRGVHGLRALGSVSERVAHRARCSVLVVHDPDA